MTDPAQSSANDRGLAPISRRLVAYLLDTVLAGVVGTVAQVMIVIGLLTDSSAGATLLVLLGLAASLAYLGFLLQKLGRRGWTPGHRALSLRVVDLQTRQPIGIPRAVARQLILGLLGPLNLIQLALLPRHPMRQGWHDLAVRSVVLFATSVPQPDGNSGPARPDAEPATRGPRAADPWAAPRIPDLSSMPVGAVQAPPPVEEPSSASGDREPRAASAPTLVAAPPGVVAPPPGVDVPVVESSSADDRVGPVAADEWEELARTQARARRTPAQAWTIRAGEDVRSVTGLLLVGRDPDPTLVPGAVPWSLQVDELTVSKTHALFGLDQASGVWVEDWGSTNGVEVAGAAGRRTLQVHERHLLAPEDRVLLGDLELVVTKEGA